MRILLDGCVPKRLAKELSVHEVQTAPGMGYRENHDWLYTGWIFIHGGAEVNRHDRWGDLDDGPLLDVMAGRFDVLVTVDKSLSKQQWLNNRPFAVIVLRAKTNHLADLLPLVPALRLAIEELRPGQVRELADF